MDSLTHIIHDEATEKDLVAIAKACPNLTYINVRDTAVTDVDRAEFKKA